MKEEVNFSDWEKIDLRVAEIIKVEEIIGADKLYKITLNAGEEIGEKIICAGIRQSYSKEELIGKKIIYFSNLKPRIMRGIESNGMLLAAVNEKESKVILVSPEKDIKIGSKIN